MKRAIPFLLVPLAACGPSFTPFREIEKPRVIGAMMDVVGDVGRVTPAPGEQLDFRLVVADDGPKAGRTWALAVCVPGTSNLDIVFCDGSTPIVGVDSMPVLPGPTDPKEDPSITFTVPDEATLGEATELWLVGAVCNGGTVRDLLNDPPVPGEAYDPCVPDPNADPAPYGQLITTRIALERAADDRNHRPQFDTVTLVRDDPSAPPAVPWTTAPLLDDTPSTGCAGQGFLEIPAYVENSSDPDLGTYLFAATSRPGDRETYFDEQLGAQVTEPLFVRVFFTDGEFDAGYDGIDDGDPVASLRYTPPTPDQVDPSGTLVRFVLQMFDDRDASTFEARAVCVVP